MALHSPSRRTLLRAGASGAAVAAAAGLVACDGHSATAATAATTTAPAGDAAHASGSASTAARRPASVSADAAAKPTAGDWSALAKAVGGLLVRPGDSRFASAEHLFQPRFDSTHPTAVAYPTSAAGVAACLAFVKKFHLAVAARNGGHSYGGWSTGSGLVIDVGRMNKVSVSGGAGGTATVGAGARLIDVYSTLNGHGVTIPAGSCPTVGVTGLTLGGGIGVVGRAYGLTCDSLLGAEVVTADGRTRQVSAHQDADLFWALRGGGGGNFGVVTSLTFRTHAAPACSYAFLSWPWSKAAAVIRAWQAWAPKAPDQLWSNLHLTATADGRLAVSSTCVMLGSTAQLATQIHRLGVQPEPYRLHTNSFFGTMQVMGGVAGETVAQAHLRGSLPGQTATGTVVRSSYGARSDLFTAPLSAAAAASLVSSVARYPRTAPSGGDAAVAFDAMGGAINRVAPSATAFVHRNALFNAQYTADYPAGVTGGSAADRSWAWLDGVWQSMRGHASGQAYQNYLDPKLTGWQQAYYGANLARLKTVKRAYDPTDLFRFPQSIPLA